MAKRVLAAAPGDRVIVKTDAGVIEATIVRIDESVFPGRVIVRGDDGQERVVLVGIGWPK